MSNRSNSSGGRKAAAVVLGAVLAATLIASLWPRERVVVPTWTLTVLHDGKPAPGARVRETWQDYSVSIGSQAEATADASGRVTFPRRIIHASPLHRTLGCFAQVLSAGVHASCGPSADIAAYVPGYEGWLTYAPGHPLPGVVEVDHEL